MEATTLSRRERERLTRRKDMLGAARAVFAEKGYTNATLDEIAQLAEFGKGTLYNYFPGGKEEILFAILDELYDDMVALIEGVFASAGAEPFRNTFSRLLVATFAFFTERQDLFMVMMKEANGLFLSEDPEKATYFLRQQDRVITALAQPLAAAMDAGLLRPLPPEAVAHLIIGNVKGLQMHICLSPSCIGSSTTTIAQGAADFLSTLLLDGLLVKPADPITEGATEAATS